MATLPTGAFERGMTTARRGFERSGLATALGQNPAQRRFSTPFGGNSTLGGSTGRSDFSGGIFGQSAGQQSPFAGKGSSRLDFSSPFAGFAWDPATGLRRAAGVGTGTGQDAGTGKATGNAAVDAAASRNGVPPAVLAALVNRESSGDWDANNRIADVGRLKPDGTPNRILPYVGIFETTAQSWGLDWNEMVGNQQAQLDGMAKIIGGIKQQQGFSDWGQAAAYYFAGPNSTNPGWRDEFGMSVADYQAKFNADVANYGGTSGAGDGQWGGNQTGQSLVDFAQQWVGTPYVLGTTGYQTWDCSGMTWRLNQDYGDGSLPQGSHEQYAYAQQNGKLYTNPGQMQAGDILFFNTGFSYRGNAASHTGIYLGNGQMLHASSPGVGTVITNINDPYYQGIFMGGMHGAVSDVSGASGAGWGNQSSTANTSPYQGVQAVNGAYYSNNYVIPTRWGR